MKYILLICNNPDVMQSLPDVERDRIMADVDKLVAELTETGEFLGGEALAHPVTTRMVRVRDGVATTGPGVIVEPDEQLAGYLTVDVESEQRAIDIAGRWPDARFGAMEVRPLMTESGTEM